MKAWSLIIMGVSGSGKTTIGKMLAAASGMQFIDGDALHPAENIKKMSEGIALTDEDRVPWLAHINQICLSAQASGNSSIVACSALKRSYRDILRRHNPAMRFIYLKGSPALIHACIIARKHHFMPVSLLESQFHTLEEPGASEKDVYTVDVSGSAEDSEKACLHIIHLIEEELLS